MLAVPATSVPCERAGSVAGNIVSHRRARMTPKLIENLAFGSMNWKFLAEYDVQELQQITEAGVDVEVQELEEDVGEDVFIDDDDCVRLSDPTVVSDQD